MKNKKEEERLHNSLADYLRVKYKKIPFTSDASGIKLNMGQAIQLKRKKSDDKIPDMIIFKKTKMYGALLLEIKKDWDSAYRKNGYIRTSSHIQGQYDTIVRLRESGYAALFVCSWEHAILVIDTYLCGRDISHLQDKRLDSIYSHYNL